LSLVATFLLLTALPAAAQTEFLPPNAQTQPLQTAEERGAIEINGNDDFQNPGNGVRRGTGGPQDPYVIENWVINAAGDGAGIRIGNANDDTFRHFVIRDVTIVGAGAGIELVRASHANVHDVDFENVQTAFKLNNASDSEFRHNGFTNVETPAHVVGSFALIFQSNDFGPGSVTVERSSKIQVLENTFSGGVLHAMHADELTFRGNTFSDAANATGPAIKLDEGGGKPSSVSENQVTGHPDVGILISRFDAVTVDANRVTDIGAQASHHGILVDQSISITLTNNVVQGSSGDGIRLTMTSDSTLDSNQVRGNAGHGISLLDASKNEVRSNTAAENTGYGIYVDAAENMIRSNTVEGNGDPDFGGGIYTGGGGYNEVRENQVTNNMPYGIYLGPGEPGDCATGNTVQETNGDDIYVDQPSDDVTVADNTGEVTWKFSDGQEGGTCMDPSQKDAGTSVRGLPTPGLTFLTVWLGLAAVAGVGAAVRRRKA
jgi:parallel beta-helix repeat protein